MISPGGELTLGDTLMRFELGRADLRQEGREQPSALSSAERDDFDAVYAKARELAQNNQYQEAKELFEELLESPEYAEGAHYSLGSSTAPTRTTEKPNCRSPDASSSTTRTTTRSRR